MKKLAIAVSMLVIGAVNASAADMATKAPMLMPASVFSWTGFYVGAEAGGLWGRSVGSFLTPPPADFSSRISTGAAGGFVGVNYQFSNNFVLGVEANVIALFSRSFNGAPCDPAASCGPAAVRTTSLDAIWSVGARAGYAMNIWMPYLSGGFAGTRATLVGVDAVPTNESATQNRFGWYVGAGVDWALNRNWILGVEYRHYDFGTAQIVPFDNLIGAFAVADAANLKITTDTVMAKVSYKFGQ